MARYRAYKGRGHRGIAVLVVFVILLVLAAAAVFILPDYIVYTDDGVRLEVPIFGWVRSTSPSGPGLEPSPVASVDIIVETPTPSPTPDPSPTPTPTPKPRLLGVPLSLLASDDKLIDLKDFAIAAGVNGLLLEIKDAEGEIAEPERLKEIAALLRDSGLELIAGISAFRDNRITRSNEGKTYGVKHSSGVNWLDNNGNRWINPYVPEARRFVIDRVLAARDAGFDGVLLDDVCFPHYGALSKINYGADATVSHIAAMGIFLDELAESATGMSLSAVVLEETISSGAHPEAGQEMGEFEKVFGELYYYVPDDMSGVLNEGVPVFYASSADLRQRIERAEATGYLVVSEDGEFPLGAFEK